MIYAKIYPDNRGIQYAVDGGPIVSAPRQDTLSVLLDYMRTGIPDDAGPRKGDVYYATVSGLQTWWQAMCHELHRAGYTDMTAAECRSKAAKRHPTHRDGAYAYIASDKLNIYSITVWDGGCTLKIMSGERVTGARPETVSELRDICRHMADITGQSHGITAPSMALLSLKQTCPQYGRLYPDCRAITLPTGETVEDYITPAYGTGLTLLHDSLSIDPGCVYDINSLYPWIMATQPLPIGRPSYGTGEPPAKLLDSSNYVTYIRCLIDVTLLPDHVPFVACRIPGMHHRLGISLGDVVTDTTDERGARVNLPVVLTEAEYELLFEQYDVHNIYYLDYIYYHASIGHLAAWVNSIYRFKQTASGAARKAYKTLLVGVVGGFAKRSVRQNAILTYQAGKGYVTQTIDRGTPSAINLAAWIIALGRVRICRDAQANYGRWLYSDTDSLHLVGTEPPAGATVSDELGDYKMERTFEEAYYWAPKSYALKQADGWHITSAGLPPEGRKVAEAVLDGRGEPLQWDSLSDEYYTVKTETEKEELRKLVRQQRGCAYSAADLPDYRAVIPVEYPIQSRSWAPRTTKQLWDFNPGKPLDFGLYL